MTDFAKIFNDVQVQDFVAAEQRKTAVLGYNNLNHAPKTRWIGTPCELAFEDWCVRNGIKYQYWATEDKIDDRDFTVSDLEIDVKGSSTNFFPKPEYSCLIAETQYKKMIRPGNIINTIVFARFVHPFNTAIIVGVISKKKFIRIAKFLPAGTVGTNGLKLTTNNYEVLISDLSPLSSIKDYYYSKEDIYKTNT